ncbi:MULTISPECIES: hypothetical protein [Synergistales]|nr:hypothetical protein [Aminithiophilus ramosus]
MAVVVLPFEGEESLSILYEAAVYDNGKRQQDISTPEFAMNERSRPRK